MKVFKKIIPLVFMFAFGFLSSSFLHFRRADGFALETAKLSTSILADPLNQGIKPSPQLREYIKAKYYWVLALYLNTETYNPCSSMVKSIDFGPIDLTQLQNIPFFKSPDDPDEIYRKAIQKFQCAK